MVFVDRPTKRTSVAQGLFLRWVLHEAGVNQASQLFSVRDLHFCELGQIDLPVSLHLRKFLFNSSTSYVI